MTLSMLTSAHVLAKKSCDNKQFSAFIVANLADELAYWPDEIDLAMGAKDLDSGYQTAFHANSGVGVAGWA